MIRQHAKSGRCWSCGPAIETVRIATIVLTIMTAVVPRALAQRVATLGANSFAASWNQDVKNKIASTGLFTAVDAIDVQGSTPTLNQLLQYDAVLVYSDAGFANNAALGNVLADYVDQGRGVVLATFAFWNPGCFCGIAGRLSTGGYLPFTQASQSSGIRLFLVTDQPLHPILQGVTSLDGGSSSYHNSPIALASGASLVAHWTNGQPLVGTKQPSAGRVVGLNFYPPSSDSRADFWAASTSGGRLMANALLWSAGQLKAPTALSVVAASGPYNGTTALSATLKSNGSPVANKAISFTLNGTAKGSAVTDGSGVATLPDVSLTTGAGPIGPGAYATGVAASFTGDSSFASSSGTASLTVNKADQTITFGVLIDKAYGDADFTVTATASSGLTVSFASLTSGVCTVSGTTVHIAATGTCSIQASQDGDTNTNVASNVVESFTVNKASQPALSLSVPASLTYGTTGTASASGGSGTGAVSFSAGTSTGCSVDSTSGVISVTNAAGTCAVSASKAGDDNYAGPVTDGPKPVALSKATQAALSLNVPPSFTYGTTGTASVSGGSGTGAVSFSAGTSTGCSVDSTSGVISVTNAAGMCAVSASKAGDGNYNGPVTDGPKAVTLNKANQAITFAELPNKTYGDPPFSVSASANSGLPVSFSASASCTASGTTVTITAGGSCMITASQLGNGNYNPAPNVSQSFAVRLTWSGVLQPINIDGTSIFKLGSTIPVKFQLTGASSAITTLGARIYVAKVANGIAGTELEATTTGNADSGNTFRYDPTAGQYIFNWGTKGLTEGTWQIRIDLLDGSTNIVNVSLKK